MTSAENIWAGSQSTIKVDFQTIEDLFTVEERPKKRTPRGSALPSSTNDSDSSHVEEMKGKVEIPLFFCSTLIQKFCLI